MEGGLERSPLRRYAGTSRGRANLGRRSPPPRHWIARQHTPQELTRPQTPRSLAASGPSSLAAGTAMADNGTKVEQFIVLAKTARGLALVDLIAKATAEPGLFTYGELLSLPGVQEASGCAWWTQQQEEWELGADLCTCHAGCGGRCNTS